MRQALHVILAALLALGATAKLMSKVSRLFL